MWYSKAWWPSTVSLGNTENTSEDIHWTEEQAKAVCRRLEKEGFGGDGKIFPIKTEYAEIPAH